MLELDGVDDNPLVNTELKATSNSIMGITNTIIQHLNGHVSVVSTIWCVIREQTLTCLGDRISKRGSGNVERVEVIISE